MYDSQASPVGTVVVGGGPFNSMAEATARMCELRTDDPADKNKCFHVKPEDACDTKNPVKAELELPDDVVRYIDTLPLTKVDIAETVLPNRQKLGEYQKALKERGKREETML